MDRRNRDIRKNVMLLVFEIVNEKKIQIYYALSRVKSHCGNLFGTRCSL